MTGTLVGVDTVKSYGNKEVGNFRCFTVMGRTALIPLNVTPQPLFNYLLLFRNYEQFFF